ncbi:MAG: DNA (cytosine-5-)-methyltransferase [Bifidobacteriaceae bacterium]|nr:DNA (cytosine-5-)-methyltransferase [Bifidobacteriaceae bacterium]
MLETALRARATTRKATPLRRPAGGSGHSATSAAPAGPTTDGSDQQASPAPPSTTTGPVTFIDLFAGLGGFHVALDKLGATCVFAAEREPDLQTLYEKNFGLRPEGDIATVDLSSIPPHTVLCAGFPCQPFSKSGKQLGFEHTEQGKLFFNVIEILGAHRPQCFILENVPNLLKHDEGRTFARIEQELRGLGYAIRHERLSPHQFTIPQIRERVYVVGTLGDMTQFAWPETSEEPTSIKTILGNEGGKMLPPRVLEALSVWGEFLELSKQSDDEELPSFPIWGMEFGATYPYEGSTPWELIRTGRIRELQRTRGTLGRPLGRLGDEDILAALPSHARREQSEFPRWKQTFIRQNREFYARNREWIDPWLPKIRGFPSSFQKFEWNAHGEERDIWQYVIQIRASGVRLKRQTTAPSLIAMTDTQVPIIAWEKRYMTPAECARLQSLGDLAMPESPSKTFRALGNAVNAEVVRRIAQSLLATIPTAGIVPCVNARRGPIEGP